MWSCLKHYLFLLKIWYKKVCVQVKNGSAISAFYVYSKAYYSDTGGGEDLRLMVSGKSREIATLLNPSRTFKI